MKSEYGHIRILKEEIMKMRTDGKTHREIAEHYGFKDRYAIKEFLKRERRKERKLANGIIPSRRGRPPKGYVPTEQDKDNEIKRLKMENELLRDFLHLAGRK